MIPIGEESSIELWLDIHAKIVKIKLDFKILLNSPIFFFQ